MACLKPRICPLIFSEMAKPAASSPARLMRRPDDNFSMFLEALVWFTPNCLCAFSAMMLLLILIFLPPCFE
jgi:hypothetical protein